MLSFFIVALLAHILDVQPKCKHIWNDSKLVTTCIGEPIFIAYPNCSCNHKFRVGESHLLRDLFQL